MKLEEILPAEILAQGSQNDDLKRLEKSYAVHQRKRYGSVPDHALVKKRFSDDSANGITNCIMTFLKLNLHHCIRVNTQGQFREDLGIWTKAGSTRGVSDIIATVDGAAWFIEVKYGRDKLSELQQLQKQSVESSGGVFMVAKSFSDFLNQYCDRLKIDKSKAFKNLSNHKK